MKDTSSLQSVRLSGSLTRHTDNACNTTCGNDVLIPRHSPDREATSAIDQALKLGSSGKAQPPLRSVNNNLDSQIERTTGILGRLRSPASSKLMDPSNVKRDLKDVLEQAKLAAGVMHGTPSTTTVSTPASSTT